MTWLRGRGPAGRWHHRGNLWRKQNPLTLNWWPNGVSVGGSAAEAPTGHVSGGCVLTLCQVCARSSLSGLEGAREVPPPPSLHQKEPPGHGPCPRSRPGPRAAQAPSCVPAHLSLVLAAVGPSPTRTALGSQQPRTSGAPQTHRLLWMPRKETAESVTPHRPQVPAQLPCAAPCPGGGPGGQPGCPGQCSLLWGCPVGLEDMGVGHAEG